MTELFKPLISFIREQYESVDTIPLHAPFFSSNELKYVSDALESTYVSSVGEYVDQFEADIARYTGSASAVAMVNGTSALHIALLLSGVKNGDLVITQPLTFVATCNAIRYCGADPVFIDVDKYTLGMSAVALSEWLKGNVFLGDDGECRTRATNRVVRACVPVHTFGHPVDIDGLLSVCQKWNIAMVEDSAEAFGSFYKGRHTGTFGLAGVLSFNGNKIVTTGGGGIVLTDEELGLKAKHISTTAKKAHAYEFVHDHVGYNYRLPNLNAALGCAQIEQIECFVKKKRELAQRYSDFLKHSDLFFVKEPANCRSNYWLNAVICPDLEHRNVLIKTTNECGIMTRPIWRLMNKLPMYASCLRGDLYNAEWLEKRVVNLPSSVV